MIQDLPEFIPGIQLCEHFYVETVRPILDSHFPGLKYSAARLDAGSDVLGFDTSQSRDHGWGPKVMLFLSPEDHDRYRESISDVMAEHLPKEIRGYPTNFDTPFSGEGTMEPIEKGPVKHWVAVETVSRFFLSYLGVDPIQPVQVLDWLTMSQQHLRTIASGVVFHDGLGQLETARDSLRWYPRDIWLYLLANQWRRIDQEEPFMARCGDVGDEFGSRIIASRQVIEISRLCFLIERQYIPYYKWFGSAFSRLECAPEFTPIFHHILNSQTWQEREVFLSIAYRELAALHNGLKLTPVIEPEISNFFDRPYQVPHSDRFVRALHNEIQSDKVKRLPEHVGAIDQFVNSTDILSNLNLSKKLTSIFE